MITMKQETYKKGYYIPSLQKTITVTKGQQFDEDGLVGLALKEYYGEDVIKDGETKSTIEKTLEGGAGGGLTTEQADAVAVIESVDRTDAQIKTGIEKIADVSSSASEIDESVSNSNKIVVLTQAEYDALTTPETDVFYAITE